MNRDCIFKTKFLKDMNPRIQAAWREDRRAGYPPFGGMTRAWKREHCPQLDPYNAGTCPYRKEDCVIAYMKTAIDAINHHPDNVVAYFSQLSRWRGAERADDKPLARPDYNGTDGHPARPTGVRTGPRPGLVDDVVSGTTVDQLRRMEDGDVGVRRTAHRCFSAGELLGRSNIRSPLATRRRDPWETTTDEHGDTHFTVPTPSPVDEMGDEPPSGTPDIREGSE